MCLSQIIFEVEYFPPPDLISTHLSLDQTLPFQYGGRKEIGSVLQHPAPNKRKLTVALNKEFSQGKI